MTGSIDMTRRGFLASTAAGVAGIALAGCGDSSDETPAASTTGTGSARFPVTIDGELGSVTVERAPKRVVSVGQYRDTDAAIALGVIPVGTPDLGKFIPGGVAPWVKRRLTGAGPELFAADTGLPLEKVAALRPDLILATDRLGLKSEYGKLSRLAPTISPAKSYNKDPWQVTTKRIGKALGRDDRAAKVVADVEARVRAAKADNPGFAGKTFTFGPVQPDGTINTINSTTDASVVFLSQLGLELSPKVTSLEQTSIPGRALISPERIDLLDADLVILTYTAPSGRARVEQEKLFQRLPAVRRGAYIALDLPTALALGFPSALSIPYGLDQMVPKIARALQS